MQLFYFTGGTALAHYYLQHRLSEDLDFFSESEFDPQETTTLIKQFKTSLRYRDYDFQNSFNRNIYHLRFPKNVVLKIEFTYYPFEQIEKPMMKEGILVDSLTDIAANKLFTIAQKPRGRDYYDLYSIYRNKSLDLHKLRIQAKTKFDWHIDPLQLGTQFNRVDEFLDDPILTKEINTKDMIIFFKTIAKDFQSDILTE